MTLLFQINPLNQEQESHSSEHLISKVNNGLLAFLYFIFIKTANFKDWGKYGKCLRKLIRILCAKQS